jgi:hypothetical protein
VEFESAALAMAQNAAASKTRKVAKQRLHIIVLSRYTGDLTAGYAEIKSTII